MFGNINPAKMQAMMKQLGIKQDEIPAKRVIIEQENSKIIINNPNVVKIDMKGQESWQITGEASEEASTPSISEEDIKIIVEKTGASEAKARQALEKTGDLAEAILELSE